MKKIKTYIQQYRKITSRNILLRDLGLTLSLLIFIFCTLLIIEYLFYLTPYTRRNYSIIYLAFSISMLSYIFIKWFISKNGFLGINSDQDIAKQIGSRLENIKDRLLNAIQLQKIAPKLDLTQLAINNLEEEQQQQKNNITT